jgi:thiol-disulfide isomerase/thioredoxin
MALLLNLTPLFIIFNNENIIINNKGFKSNLPTIFVINNYILLLLMPIHNILNSIDDLQAFLNNNSAVLLYFSTNSCSVGEALEPKVENLVNSLFPEIKFISVDLNSNAEIAAYFSAFVEPTILVFFEGKETIRRSRNVSIFELEEAIKRPYKLIFE